MVTNINFLLTISIDCPEIKLWELISWSPKRKCLDLLSNSLNPSMKETYRDQFWRICMWILGLKGLKSNMATTTTTKMGLTCNGNEEKCKYNISIIPTGIWSLPQCNSLDCVMWLCQISMIHQEISLQTLLKCLPYLF